MAANTSFKQTCPSCEERVLIKDVKLVGKKIDCPKCKYRFVVEAPKEEAEEGQEEEVAAETKPAVKKAAKATVKTSAAAAKAEAKGDAKAETNGKSTVKKVKVKKAKDADDDDDDDRPFKKKSDKGSKKLVAISAIVGFAVLLLGVAAYFVFFTGETTKPTKGSGLTGAFGSGNKNGGGDDDGGKEDGGAKPKAKGPDVADASNHCLPDTDQILSIKVKDFLASPLGKTLFDPAGGIPAEMLKQKTGIAIEEMERVLITGNEKADWLFVIIRSTSPMSLDTLTDALKLEKSGNAVRGRDYLVTQANWRDSLPGPMVAMVGKKKAAGARPMAFHLYDAQTLVFGDVEPMKQFLEYDGKPPAQQNIGIPAARGGPMAPRPPAMPPGAPGAAPAAAQADEPYSTLDPRFKSVLERVETKQPVLLSMAANIPAAGAGTASPVQQVPGLQGVNFVRFGFSLDGKDGLGASVVLECKTMDEARKFDEAVKKLLPLLPPELESRERIAVDLKKDANQPGFGPNPTFRPPGPMGPMPPVNPAAPKDPKDPAAAANPADPMLTIEGPKTSGAFVHLSATLNTNAYQMLNLKYLSPGLHQMRGQVELAQKQPAPHDLANALRASAEKGKAYPRAAAERTPEAGRPPWHPNQRVSFFADLLPLLGYQDLHREINMQKSWNEGDNLSAAMTLIPYFIVPEYAPHYRYVQAAGVPGQVGATHYVGIGGVGLDAAEYEAGGPNAAKMGVFGYNRTTPLADVGGNTIVLIQVPPPTVGPWMAGGGATVRGVPEKNSIKPFVSTSYNNKPGTFAMMADGSVRFIGADIADAVFKGLATVNKNPPPEGFDQKYPVVPAPPRQNVLRAGPK
jgi:hypothetical protein